MSENPKWEVGQVAYVISRATGVTRTKVTAVTSKHVAVSDGSKFRLSGDPSGRDPWISTRLWPSTPELARQFAVQQAKYRIQTVRLDQLTEDRILRLGAFIQALQEEQKQER